MDTYLAQRLADEESLFTFCNSRVGRWWGQTALTYGVEVANMRHGEPR